MILLVATLVLLGAFIYDAINEIKLRDKLNHSEKLRLYANEDRDFLRRELRGRIDKFEELKELIRGIGYEVERIEYPERRLVKIKKK